MAAVDYFLKIDGITGESQDSKHAGEIEILSWSWGENQSGSFAKGGGGGSGKVAMQDFHVTKLTDKASPKLFLECATGQHIPTVVLTCRKAGKNQMEFLKITFKEVLVSSFQSGGSAGSDLLPVDQVSFNFAIIQWEYKEQLATGVLGGAVTAGYNQQTNAAI
jgi:type VI secretion system secreted protein Hcp